ncbi:four helix bundle protein [Gemmata sp. JC717]|uniref:four helix bundle protein n=1 Tax=Gemmata algarum TaxID=2975278 RepID=UPI0021BB4626|nr:four helix bundle protein [Gemmata algarum]MDY3551195.1 four helix bundle protein [Gemmata algarum]
MPPFDICERTFDFAVRIVNLCSTLCEHPGPSRRLGDQLLRAGTSIGANVEEGRAGQSRADFISKNAIALKEAREAAYWLRLISATVLPNSDEVRDLHEEAQHLKRILGAIVARSVESF